MASSFSRSRCVSRSVVRARWIISRPIGTFTRNANRQDTSVSRAADDKAQHRADARHRGEHRRRGVAGRAFGERRRDQRQPRRGGDRGANALQQPRGDQGRLVPRDAAQDGGDGEQRDADDEGPLAADGVAEASPQQHQPAERQHVSGDDPAAAGVGQAQFVLNLRKRDDGDRAVHGGQQLHTADRDDRGDEAPRRQPGRVPAGLLLCRVFHVHRQRPVSPAVGVAADGGALCIIESRHRRVTLQ